MNPKLPLDGCISLQEDASLRSATQAWSLLSFYLSRHQRVCCPLSWMMRCSFVKSLALEQTFLPCSQISHSCPSILSHASHGTKHTVWLCTMCTYSKTSNITDPLYYYRCTYYIHTFIFLQKLEADEEDSYLNAEWADPQALKRQFTGMANISWRPK